MCRVFPAFLEGRLLDVGLENDMMKCELTLRRQNLVRAFSKQYSERLLEHQSKLVERGSGDHAHQTSRKCKISPSHLFLFSI